ncbi:hypothetical protein [Halopenitus persicus]|uniref:hypothetical protein n=1 Tax=Halopenitus persicus TaxID=1048396 RepID=UPI000BBAF51B|nr:hypothetical protein [Halopenitus persicus]
MSEDKQKWKQTSGFAGDTEVAQVVCKEEDFKQWDEEAEENGKSRSRYLYSLIQEARAYRRHGLNGATCNQKRVQELEDEVSRLQKRVEEKESESSEAISFDPSTLKQDVLTDQYQSLEDILRRIVEEGILDDVLRQPVENQLYFLAAQDMVEYERGWGWKLTEDNGGAA